MSPSPTTVVLWDIDGTLLSTARAGIRSWEDAARVVLGRDLDLTAMRTSGLTDPMIAREILVATGQPADPVVEAAMARAYTKSLPARLTERRGGVLPGVQEALDAMAACPSMMLALLTGNMRAGAWAKLESYGLRQYFDTGGFGDDGFDRATIGRVALERAAAIAGHLDLDRVFLVGDSPYDVACARAVGIRMIAVASGEHTLVELQSGDPWWAVEQLPPPERFLAPIGLPWRSTAAPPGAVASGLGAP